MSRWDRVLVAACGVVMIVGGVLVWEGNRSGWLLGAGAALACVAWLALARRSG